MHTPIALFIFRRPDLTKRVFSEIAKARPERLFVIADGPRPNVEGDSALTSAARRETEIIDWPCDVVRIYADRNLGLAARFFSGLDEVFSRVETCVILEDDCLPNPSFFIFCEELLEKYFDTPSVGIISGSNFAPTETDKSYFFSQNAFIWGWATWARTWKTFGIENRRSSFSSREIRNLRASYSSFWEMVFSERLIRALPFHKSWAIPFSVHLRKRGFLNAVPFRNLVENLGQRAGGTNDFLEGWEPIEASDGLAEPIIHPSKVELDKRAEVKMWSTRGMNLVTFLFKNPGKLGKRVRQEFVILARTRSLKRMRK